MGGLTGEDEFAETEKERVEGSELEELFGQVKGVGDAIHKL